MKTNLKSQTSGLELIKQRDDWKEIAETAYAFLESLPHGWLAHTTGDIAALNDFYIKYRKAKFPTAGEASSHTAGTSRRWAQRCSELENACETLQGELDHITAQRDELLAALKRAQRVIDGSDGSNLPAIRREEKIDEILATAIAAAERSNEQ